MCFSSKVLVSPVGVNQLLSDVVEEIPATICEGTLQERQSYQTNIIIREGLEGVRRLQPVVVTWNPEEHRLGYSVKLNPTSCQQLFTSTI